MGAPDIIQQSIMAVRRYRNGVTVDELADLSDDVQETLDSVREAIFQPAGIKTAPRFTTTAVADLCGISLDTMMRRLPKAAEFGLSKGESVNIRRTLFTLAETIAWVRRERKVSRRPAGAPGCCITTGNFKGGVGKTTLAVSIAQGLSLRGYKVLCIDLDPQGSMTSVLGFSPIDIDGDQTFLPLAMPPSNTGYRATLKESIRPTYWFGLDLVPGSTDLFGAEFYLPLRQMQAAAEEPGFRFNEVLERALAGGLREEYDFIIIDTPPALSYVTMNAFWASDGILMPLPAEGLDFASSAQFWSMFSQLANSAGGPDAPTKEFGWVTVVPSKVDNKQITQGVMKWMQDAYGSFLSTAHIPMTDAAKVGSARLRTVYDIEKYAGDYRTYARAREAFDRLVDEVELLTQQRVWATES